MSEVSRIVLSRKEGEAIVIGQDIELTVIEFGEDIVKLRISFPLQPRSLFIEFWTGEAEEFRIGEFITGQISRLSSDRLRVRIEANRSVPVNRKEVLAQRSTSIPKGAVVLAPPAAPAPRVRTPRAPARLSSAIS